MALKPRNIVAKLRQVDELTSLGRSVGDALLSIGVTEVAYQRWRSEFGGLARTLRPSWPALIDESEARG
jgi:hypothetical protein